MCVVIVLSASSVGTYATAASAALTAASVPVIVHTPVPAVYVSPLPLAAVSEPSEVFATVSVAVIISPVSTSVTATSSSGTDRYEVFVASLDSERCWFDDDEVVQLAEVWTCDTLIQFLDNAEQSLALQFNFVRMASMQKSLSEMATHTHGKTYELLATNQLDDTIDASPVVVGKKLYLRGDQHLYCISEQRSY